MSVTTAERRQSRLWFHLVNLPGGVAFALSASGRGQTAGRRPRPGGGAAPGDPRPPSLRSARLRASALRRTLLIARQAWPVFSVRGSPPPAARLRLAACPLPDGERANATPPGDSQ